MTNMTTATIERAIATFTTASNSFEATLSMTEAALFLTTMHDIASDLLAAAIDAVDDNSTDEIIGLHNRMVATWETARHEFINGMDEANILLEDVFNMAVRILTPVAAPPTADDVRDYWNVDGANAMLHLDRDCYRLYGTETLPAITESLAATEGGWGRDLALREAALAAEAFKAGDSRAFTVAFAACQRRHVATGRLAC